MPKVLFKQELEIQFSLQYFHDVSMDSQGKMVSQLSVVADKLNKFAKDTGLGDLACTVSILKNNLDFSEEESQETV